MSFTALQLGAGDLDDMSSQTTNYTISSESEMGGILLNLFKYCD